MHPLRNMIQEWQCFENLYCNAVSFRLFRRHFTLLKHVLIETCHLYNHIFFVSFIVHVYGFLLNVNFKRNAIVAKSYDMSFLIIGILLFRSYCHTNMMPSSLSCYCVFLLSSNASHLSVKFGFTFDF